MAHHPWYRFPLLWPCSSQVGAVSAVPVFGCHGSVSSLSTYTCRSNLIQRSVTFQWMFWGYSLAYSRTASPFIGNMDNFGLKNVMAAPSPGSAFLPEIVFCMYLRSLMNHLPVSNTFAGLYQMLFCTCTVQLVIGGSFERGRILPSMGMLLALVPAILPHRHSLLPALHPSFCSHLANI